MIDVIEPTWAEVNSYFAIAIALIGFIVFTLIKAKIEENTSILDRDWEDYE